MTKCCSICGEEKPLDEFYNNKQSKDGKRSYCKPCNYAHKQAWRKSNPDINAEHQRRARLKHRYGITAEQFDEMLAEQDNRCAICGTTEPGGRNGTFHVDHCHSSGAVRGLLCHKCNLGIGMLNDSIHQVLAASLYLADGAGLTAKDLYAILKQMKEGG